MNLSVCRFGLQPLAAAALVLLAADAAVAFQSEKSCSLAADTFANEPALERTRAALSAGGTVAIVAIGGASTVGRAAGDIQSAWPARLSVALAARFPAARITVTNRAVARQSTAEMLKRFDRDVLSLRPTLVIWETGTSDAVRGEDAIVFREAVQTGIDRLRAAGAEVALMDMQFSRRVMAMMNVDRYRHILRELADVNDVALFRRHEIMRGWAEEGVFDFSVVDGDKRRAMATRLYDCIGRAVAQMIAQDASGSPSANDAPR